jgi:hypothetical protein
LLVVRADAVVSVRRRRTSSLMTVYEGLTCLKNRKSKDRG